MEPPPYLAPEVKEFNPADLENLVRFCVQELESRRAHRLPLPAPFDGAGIYALYYDGDFPLYQHPAIRSPTFTQPIYVGRARLTKSSGPQPLYGRLADHAESIAAVAPALRVEDFACRFLVLHPVWVSTVEDLLIEHFDTLWNGPIKGFGLHDPGGKRHTGLMSQWDSLHPGRKHQRLMEAAGGRARAHEEIEREIEAFLARRGGQPVSLAISREEVERSLRQALPDDDDA